MAVAKQTLSRESRGYEALGNTYLRYNWRHCYHFRCEFLFLFFASFFFFFNSNWLLNVCIYGKILLFIVWCYLNSYWQSQSEREWLKLELYVLQWLCWYWVFGMWLYFAYTPTCISLPRPKITCSWFSYYGIMVRIVNEIRMVRNTNELRMV